MDRHHSKPKLKLRLMLAIVIVCCLVLAVKLFALQVFASGYYRKASIDNSVRIVPIKAPRGIILDRNNEVIVQNRPSYSVYLVPHDVPNIDIAAARLAGMLQMDESYLKQIISSGWKGRFQPIRLKRDVDFKTISILEEHSLDVPGLVFQVEPTRLYPDSGHGSHLYGYVGEVSESELSKNENAERGDIIGKKGLERYYNDYLKGRDGVLYLQVTAKGRILGKYADRQETPPVTGDTLVLNIDWPLQKKAETLLFEKGQGSVVAIDVATGGVLAFASSPVYDANLFSGVVPADKWAEIMADSTFPLLNRTIQGIYPPGSTFKAFTAAMALNYDKVKDEKQFDSCRGQKKFGNRFFKCWRPGGHGKQDLHGAIVRSCDVYFYQLGLACGMEQFGEFMPQCRFGELTGIDILGEKSGISPSISYFDERYGKKGWTRYLMNNLAIGQGEILVTPLQMAVLYAALANGGTVYKPAIVKKIIKNDGADIVMQPETMTDLPITKKHLEIINNALMGVVSEEDGTASWLKIPGITLAGKTGTAQNPHGDDHAWFVCFAPFENPEIAVAVIVENAGHGSSVAAPVARDVLKFYFERQEPEKSEDPT
ncbi:MAG: penicillin-binding protein 2 [candidate division Zixibacteria bacterium]|nr:penicillin-binding protein 2 [candidate division Zixibacteria bacterium]